MHTYKTSEMSRFTQEIKHGLEVAKLQTYQKVQGRIVSKRGAVEDLDPEVVRERKRASQLMCGAAQLSEMFRLLDSFGMQRSNVQRQLHLGMAGAILQRIFHLESDAEIKVAMDVHRISSDKQQFMAITPRRFGKTTAVAMFVAAFALAIPGTTTAIFSTGRRASNLLLQQIKTLLLQIPGAKTKIVSSNVETLHLSDNGLISKISSFPGKARTLRGTGGDLIILEEAAFISSEVWTEVVIPLIEVKNTALVAISTPLDSSNFYSVLVNMKDENENRVFEVLEARAACQACIETLEDPSKCPHVQLERPTWKSKEKQKVVKALYAGNEQTMLRESLGVVTEGSNGIFIRKQVNRLFETSRSSMPLDTEHIYVAIDPSGGGPSHFAICSAIRNKGTLQVTHASLYMCRTHASLYNTLEIDRSTVESIEMPAVRNEGIHVECIFRIVDPISQISCKQIRQFSSQYLVNKITHFVPIMCSQ